MEMTHPSPRGSVLLEFRGTNVRSYRDEFRLSLLATTLAEKNVVRQVEWRDGGHTVGVLPLAAIYGANASGKSNALRVLSDMRDHVLHSFRLGNPTGGMPRRPFLLDPAGKESPSTFHIDLVLDGVRHTYEFTIDGHRVLREQAVRYPRGRSALLFSRDGDRVDAPVGERSLARTVKGLLRPNALFLSTAAATGHPSLLPIYAWFGRNLLLAEAESRDARQSYTVEMLDSEHSRDDVLALIKAADLGITGVRTHPVDPVMRERMARAIRVLMGEEGSPDGDIGPAIAEQGIGLLHSTSDGGEIELDVEDESQGTLVWLGLVGPVLHALREGAVLLADELDTSLHPELCAQLVHLFQNPETNPRRAQLIFNTHDTMLLGDGVSHRIVGRDQIWFADKDADGSTRLTPLSDHAPRRQEAVARRYLSGRYGAVPIVSQMEFAAAMRSAPSNGQG